MAVWISIYFTQVFILAWFEYVLSDDFLVGFHVPRNGLFLNCNVKESNVMYSLALKYDIKKEGIE